MTEEKYHITLSDKTITVCHNGEKIGWQFKAGIIWGKPIARVRHRGITSAPVSGLLLSESYYSWRLAAGF